MYTVSDVVDMGAAHELILSDMKVTASQDDSQLNTFQPPEYFDE